MANIERLRATLGEAMAENNAHATMLHTSGAEVHSFYGTLLNVADYVSRAIDAGNLVIGANDQVRNRLVSNATQQHSEEVALMFSVALFGNGTGLDRGIERALNLARGGERNAENMMEISKTKLEQALGHLASAYDLLRPDETNTAATRMHAAEASINAAVDARVGLNIEVEDYMNSL